MKPRPVLIVALLLAMGCAGLYFYTRPEPLPPEPEPSGPLGPSEGVPMPTRDFLANLIKTPESNLDGAPQKAPEITIESGTLSWEKQLAEILQDPGPDNLKGPRLLALIPSLPEEAYGPATSQALEWLQDTDYVATALPILLDVHTHGAVLNELYRDMVDRPPAIALPSLLAIARIPEHPYSVTARETLVVMMGEDLDNNWAAWNAAVRQRVASGQ